ncbi:MAG: lysine 2,3-aminomutase, partial [Micavibrio aeruginosavorus]
YHKEDNKAYAYIEARPYIKEVILTGGDPLTLSNRRLKDVLDRLSAIPHLDIIRFHTRTPLVSPERVDDGLCALLESMEKAVYVVLHVNHAQEINAPVREAFRRLNRAGAVLLSQSVLLKGVNDDPAILEDLFRTLLKHRVKPYYLHHPDLAPGTGHFRLSIKRGQEIVSALRGRVTGLAWPTYVLDIPGGHGKMPLLPSYIEERTAGCYLVEDYQGIKHEYKDDVKSGTE